MLISRLVGLRGRVGMAMLLWRLAPRRARRVVVGIGAVALLWAVTLVAVLVWVVHELT
jgi:hypothetical protein